MDDFTPDDIAQIEAIIAADEAKAAPAKPGMVDTALNQLGEQISSAAGPLGIDALNNYASGRLADYNKTVKPTPAGQLPQASDLYAQASEQGRKMMEPKAKASVAPKDGDKKAIGNVSYTRINGVWQKDK